ncbi:MAG: hydrogenase formation protein HypD [Verrucomicrobiales bacterium]|nr:hydrogenase formation protein HypD [Verrucomicrobiales bacterium]
MKYQNEYRGKEEVRKILDELQRIVTREHSIMEICGGQTHTLVGYGLLDMLPKKITMIHGPGCPVCVTPISILDNAVELALEHDVTLFSFGDMLRIPGTSKSLLEARAEGGKVKAVYSPLEAVTYAEKNPNEEVVFLSIGFETTMPANAYAVDLAKKRGLENFSILVSHVLVPPAVEAVMSDPLTKVDALLAAGHVCTITGLSEYGPLVEKVKIPIVVTGFEPLDLLQGILMAVKQLEAGEIKLENQYGRVVKAEGNPAAMEVTRRVFEITDMEWRGLGVIPRSGLQLRPEYADFDASLRFSLDTCKIESESECIAADILKGIKKPPECPAFGTRCVPENPLGAPMVSNEGACSAYYQHAQMTSI